MNDSSYSFEGKPYVSPFGEDDAQKVEEKKPKKRAEAPLTRDGVIRRINNRHGSHHESPLATLQEIFEEARDKDRFVGDTMFWKYFEDIDPERVKDTKSVEYRNLMIMFYETIFYVVMLVIFTIYTEVMYSKSVYEARKEQLDYWGGCNVHGDCDLHQVNDMNSFWSWMRGHLVDRTFTPYDYPEIADIETTFSNNDFTLHFHPRFFGPIRSTVLLGTVRLRALRVQKNAGCKVSKMFAHAFPDCYGQYSEGFESKDTYSPRFIPTYLMGAFDYSDAEKTKQITTPGKMATYPGGGFMIDLPTNKPESLMMIDDLRRGSWVDQSTRAVIVELSALNTNVNVIVNSRILFEFGPTGAVEVTQKAQAAQVFHFTPSTSSSAALNVMVVQLLLLLFIIIYACWVCFMMYKTTHNFVGGSSAPPPDEDEDAGAKGFIAKLIKMFEKVKAKKVEDNSVGKDPDEFMGTSVIWILFEDKKRVYGRKGGTLEGIKKKSKVQSIKFFPDDDKIRFPPEERRVEIHGYYRERTTAVTLILKRVKFARDENREVLKDTRNDSNIVVKGTVLFFRTCYHYLRYEWNMMDFLILVLFVVHFGYRCDVYAAKGGEDDLAPEVLGHPEKFMPFSRVMSPLVTGSQVLAVLSICAWIKLFKYLCMIGYFRLLIRILEHCAKELIVFSMILLVFFFGFAVCFFVAFGSYEADFSTISGSFLVLFFLLIDGQKVEPLWFAPGTLQIMPLVFFCYIAIVYFVLLNVFLAIVLDVYAITNHLYVQQHKKLEGKANPMGTFIYTYIKMAQGRSLVTPPAEDGHKAEDLKIELRRLPGLVRRKWIEKKRKMQRVANESFAGLVLFPDDQHYLMKDQNNSATDWMLPNSNLEMEKMQNPGAVRPPSVYDIPDSMLDQTVKRDQLQRLMDEDETLPLLLGTRKAVEVIKKFKKKEPKPEGEAEKDEFGEDMVEAQYCNNCGTILEVDPFAQNKGGIIICSHCGAKNGLETSKEVAETQRQVFARIDDLERIPPELEVPDVPRIKKLTEEMSNALTDVQNQFRIQLTSIIEACAVLFEHLVELTQGMDAVSKNHQEVLSMVHDSSSGDSIGSQGNEMLQ
mmetsp:Transcript_44913/g.80918  ORF Transcript_44913/g.80918 Transcript_44913/m.80918 type:complete len:1095 (-) Transcript_44913:255-3539(-)